MANPINFVPKVSAEVPWHTAHHIKLLYQKLNGLAQAVANIPTATSTATKTIVERISPGGGGGGTSSPVGTVNNQVGQTSYTTQPTDNGSLIILNDASPIAVTLGVAAATPWFTVLANLGTGTATLTPATGTISYFGNPASASMPLLGGYWAWVGFDGINFWAAMEPIVPVNTPAISHQWLNSYNAATGQFTQTQPAYSDISGTPVIPATFSPVSNQFMTGYDAGSGTFSAAQPSFSNISGQITTSQLPASGLSVTITTAKLTTGGANGSMTFTNGILTAQTQAT